MDMRELALTIISKNPTIANNPQYQPMIGAIQNGDNKKGEEIANNLCNSFGVSKEEGIKMAKAFFGIK